MDLSIDQFMDLSMDLSIDLSVDLNTSLAFLVLVMTKDFIFTWSRNVVVSISSIRIGVMGALVEEGNNLAEISIGTYMHVCMYVCQNRHPSINRWIHPWIDLRIHG